MKIELRRFSTNARLSQETTAFAADVWVDGKKVGHASNDGRGGATMVHLDKSVRDQVEVHGKSLVPAEYASFTGGAEWIVDQLVEAEIQRRADRSFTKRLAKTDAQEKTKFEARGLGVARLRHGDTWMWFPLKPGTDPRTIAEAVATKNKIAIVDELVVL